MLRLIDRRTATAWLLAAVVLALSGCAGVGSTPSPSPTPGPVMNAAELRLYLASELGPLWYCDRDEYPVGRDELTAMRETWPDLIADATLAGAILSQLRLPPLPAAGLTDDQRLQVYRLWKMASAISLEDIGNDRYRFDYLARPVPGAEQGKRTAGIVDSRGAITVEQEALEGEPMCPICLDRLTTIDTPTGPIAVDRLRLGDVVWTLDASGRRVAATVIALGSTPAPADHHVVRVTLADGRSVSASPGHPLADGRTFADLRVGDEVDGSAIVAVATVRYAGGETFDLVVSGETGIYLAGGIPLRSTLD